VRWFTVWCQGGDADDFRYDTLVEPPDEIDILPNPFRSGDFFRVLGPKWKNATTYVRVPDVEQFPDERIYYPKVWVEGK
jgi:hypothetical protein